MRCKIAYYIILIATLLAAFPLQAEVYRVETVPNVQVADGSQHVSDPAGYIDATYKSYINDRLSQLRDSNSVEVAVVILPSIGNEDIDNFATELFTHWGIGKSQNDNGLLFIAALEQREIVIRTGYGIEGVLPDILCSRIIRQYITPAFREGNYGKGMADAIDATLHIIMTPEASAELMAEESLLSEEDKELLIFTLYLYLIMSLVISLMISMRLHRTLKSYKNNPLEGYKVLVESDGLIIITAILFPAWSLINLIIFYRSLKKMRTQPRSCDKCGTAMHRLSESEDNHFLTPQEDAEERIGSVDYDVWMCDNCRNTEVFRFDNRNTRYSECPHCHTKAYSLSHDNIIIAPTRFSTGQGEQVYNCSYCKLRKVVPYTIPMIVVPTNNNSGFGGGGFGGGFGGGMTGGGGARGGW